MENKVLLKLVEELNELDVDDEIAKHNTLVEIKDHEANLNVLVSNISNTENSIKRSNTKLQTLEANLLKAKEGVCPACGQETAHLDTHEEYTADLNTEITEERTYNDTLTTKEKDLKKLLRIVDTLPLNDINGKKQTKEKADTTL